MSIMLKKMLFVEYNRRETLNTLLKQVRLGRMLNPFVKKPISNFGVSLVGLAPKYEAN